MSELFFTFGILFFISTIITQVIVMYSYIKLWTDWFDLGNKTDDIE